MYPKMSKKELNNVKIKRDPFIAEFQELVLETATRKHYGYKGKASTATGSMYTIPTRGLIGKSIKSSLRRGMIRAKGTSVQRGTGASKKDPIAARVSRSRSKSMKAKHSYVSTSETEVETADKALEAQEALQESIQDMSVFGILDWAKQGGLGSKVQAYLNEAQRIEERQNKELLAARRGMLKTGKYKKVGYPWGAVELMVPEVRMDIQQTDLPLPVKDALSQIFTAGYAQGGKKFVPTMRNLRMALLHAIRSEEGAKILSPLLQHPEVQKYAQTWTETPSVEPKREKEIEKQLQRDIEAERAYQIGKGSTVAAQQKALQYARPFMTSKRRPGSMSQFDLDYETPEDFAADFAYELPGSKAVSTDYMLAAAEGVPFQLVRSYGYPVSKKIWPMANRAMYDAFSKYKKNQTAELLYTLGEDVNRDKLGWLAALRESPEILTELKTRLGNYGIPFEDVSDAIFDYMDFLHKQREDENQKLVFQPEQYLNPSNERFPTYARRYLSLLRNALNEAGGGAAFERSQQLQAYIDAFRDVEKKLYASLQDIRIASELQQPARQSILQNIRNSGIRLAQRMLSQNEMRNAIRSAYEWGRVKEKLAPAGVKVINTEPTGSFSTILRNLGIKPSAQVMPEIIRKMFDPTTSADVLRARHIDLEEKAAKGDLEARRILLRGTTERMKQLRGALSGTARENPAVLQSMAQEYLGLKQKHKDLEALMPEYDPAIQAQLMHVPEEQRKQILAEIFRGKYPQAGGLRGTRSRVAHTIQLLEQESKKRIADENFDAYLEKIVKATPEELKAGGLNYHTIKVGKDYGERIPNIIDSVQQALLEDAKEEAVESIYPELPKHEKEKLKSLIYAKYQERLNSETGLTEPIPGTAKLNLRMPGMAIDNLPNPPALDTANAIARYKSLAPEEIEENYYELTKTFPNAATRPVDALNKMKIFRFLRNFYGPAIDLNRHKFEYDPTTKQWNIPRAYPDKPSMLVDPADPETTRRRSFNAKDWQNYYTNYSESMRQLGYGQTGEMFHQYEQLLPGSGRNTRSTIRKVAVPIYSQYWAFSERPPSDVRIAAREPAEIDEKSHSWLQKNFGALFKAPRNMMLPPDLKANEDVRKQLVNMVKVQQSARAAEMPIPKVPSTVREQKVKKAADEDIAEQMREQYQQMVHETLRPRGQITIPQATGISQPTRIGPPLEQPETKPIPGTQVSLEEKPITPPQQEAMQAQVRRSQAKTVAPEVETQDVLRNFLKTHAEFGEEGYNIAGRPTQGKSTTGEKFRSKKKKGKFLGQGGEGSGMGLKAKVGIRSHIHDLHEYMRRTSNKMRALKPQNQMREHIEEIVVDQTNPKNNKPPTTTLNYKPGSYKGQRPYRIMNKMLISPKDTQDDGNLGAKR